MKVLGITGGIGSGKSTVMEMLKNRYGAVVLLADDIGHTAMDKDTVTFRQMTEAFGKEILDADGNIDRNILSGILMSSEEKLAIQNSIVHPYVIDKINEAIAECKSNGIKLVAVESAILYEAGCDALCDEVWYVAADTDVRVKRLIKDRGYTKEKAYAFIQKQKPDEYFFARCSRVIYNNDDIENLSLFDGSDTIVSLHLYDESQLNEYREMIEDEDIIMGLLYIDDYEESLRDCEELQRSLLTALIERQIAKNMQMIDGVYKKMEKDRYFIIFRHKYLQVLKENKFKILEDVRNVKVANNDVHLTISIGLGVHADSYAKKYDYARAAIDLAIGRGGDQAVIKDGEDINYYGGNNLQKDINTRVRARVKANALNELIVSADQTYIMGHIGCDIDSFGAAVGIYSIARNLKRTAKIVLAHDDRASIQATLDEYKNKSDYNGFIIDKNEAIYNITADTLLVIVDVNKPSLVECPELLTMTHNIVVIDHHRQTGDRIKNQILSYIEPFASSTSEMVTEFFQYINGGIRPNSLEADTLYSGIMVDTNNFTVQTSPRTFEAVTYLRRSSNDISRIRKRFRCDPEEYMTRAQAISNAKVFADYYAITTVPSNATGNIPVIGAKVANSLLEMKNIKASFVLSEYKSRIQISARSIDDANVQLIMEKLGGGGHSTVAAAQLDMSLSEAVAALKEVITNMIKEGDLK